MVYKLEESIDEDVIKIKEANEKLAQCLDEFKGVIERINNGNWKGKSKDAGLSLCRICEKYHTELLKNAEDEYKVVSDFVTSAKDYTTSGNIPSKWR